MPEPCPPCGCRLSLARLDETIAVVEQVPPVFDAFLDNSLKEGKTLRPMFDRFAGRYTAGMKERAAKHGETLTARAAHVEGEKPEDRGMER